MTEYVEDLPLHATHDQRMYPFYVSDGFVNGEDKLSYEFYSRILISKVGGKHTRVADAPMALQSMAAARRRVEAE